MALPTMSVGYPIDFRSGGDTIKQGFNKHIQEIVRIYGYLNALNSDKLSASDYQSLLNSHINSSSPHPNWNPTLASLSGNLPASRVSGDLTNATIAGSKVSGALTGASIGYGNVTGLDAHINALINAASSGSSSDSPISAISCGTSNGKMTFSGGGYLQWGHVSGTLSYSSGNSYGGNITASFLSSFSNAQYALSGLCYVDKGTSNYDYIAPASITRNSGSAIFRLGLTSAATSDPAATFTAYVDYIAIGK